MRALDTPRRVTASQPSPAENRRPSGPDREPSWRTKASCYASLSGLKSRVSAGTGRATTSFRSHPRASAVLSSSTLFRSTAHKFPSESTAAWFRLPHSTHPGLCCSLRRKRAVRIYDLQKLELVKTLQVRNPALTTSQDEKTADKMHSLVRSGSPPSRTYHHTFSRCESSTKSTSKEPFRLSAGSGHAFRAISPIPQSSRVNAMLTSTL